MKINKNSQGVYYWTDYINGKRIKRESKKWKYKYQAQADYDEFIQDNSELVSIDLTFEQLFDKYIEFSSLKNKLSHTNKMQYDVGKYGKDLFKMKVKSITPATITNWQTKLMSETTKKGDLLGNSYLYGIQSTVRRVFSYGVDNKLTQNNPTTSMIIARRKNPVIVEDKRILTLAEFEQFIDCVDELEFKALFSVLYWCGLRMGEAIALTFADYKDNRLLVSKSYDNANQIITTTKTNKSRYVDVPKRCGMLLDELIEYYSQFDHNDESSLFGLYKWIAPSTIRRKRDEALKQSKIEAFKIHDLRHSHVSTLIDLGFNAFEISKRLGHSVEMVNNTYGHLFPSKQKAMIDKLNEL